MTRAALVACVVLAACGRAERSDVVEIRFWGMGREGEVVGEMVPEFERRHPGLRVRVQQIPWTAAHEKLLTAFVGDATPDVAQLGNTWVPEFVALDALEPLDALAAASPAASANRFFAGSWDTNVVDGSAYGIPWYVDTRVLFYRTDLLRAAGYASMPQTWAEWRTALQRIKSRMRTNQFPILLPTNEWPQPLILGMQTGADVLREGGRYGNFSDPQFRRGFEFYISLFRDGLAPAVSASEISNRYQEFAAGNIAMMITGPWEIGEFRNRMPAGLQDRWGTAPLPGPDGPGHSLALGASLVIFRESPNKAAAWKFIEYLSEPAQQIRFYELTGDLPTTREAWSAPALTDNKYAHAFRVQLERVRPLPKVPEAEQIVNKLFEQGERAARNQVTVEQALRALDREVDVLLEKRRWLLTRAEGQHANR